MKSAFHFYERQSRGLGAYFLNALHADIDTLKLRGGIHPMPFGDYHRMMSKRFPFAIYYYVENNTANVTAVIDCRRDPEWVRTRLR